MADPRYPPSSGYSTGQTTRHDQAAPVTGSSRQKGFSRLAPSDFVSGAQAHAESLMTRAIVRHQAFLEYCSYSDVARVRKFRSLPRHNLSPRDQKIPASLESLEKFQPGILERAERTLDIATSFDNPRSNKKDLE